MKKLILIFKISFFILIFCFISVFCFAKDEVQITDVSIKSQKLNVIFEENISNTVGGAIFGNAGIKDHSISDNLIKIDYQRGTNKANSIRKVYANYRFLDRLINILYLKLLLLCVKLSKLQN